MCRSKTVRNQQEDQAYLCKQQQQQKEDPCFNLWLWFKGSCIHPSRLPAVFDHITLLCQIRHKHAPLCTNCQHSREEFLDYSVGCIWLNSSVHVYTWSNDNCCFCMGCKWYKWTWRCRYVLVTDNVMFRAVYTDLTVQCRVYDEDLFNVFWFTWQREVVTCFSLSHCISVYSRGFNFNFFFIYIHIQTLFSLGSEISLEGLS